ncbi:MAG TPA: dockerin type I repeat-containing protein [Ruminococcus sp.]|nr:dockerin type I repeat-containing protein [Ruminococcus sp.]HOH86656.1 dockerin type I repeat-containing protein [Ruminococcus sp.]
MTGSSPTVSGPVRGDVNNDGNCNVADLTAMQRFLLGKDSLAAPLNGDLCSDGVIDVFDMIALRKHILSTN